MSVPNVPPEGTPEGARAAGRGYWFTPLPTYLSEAVYDPDSPVNAPAVILWVHIHRHYAWRERIFPSCATLAEETGLGERTVARLLQTLRSAGALTWGAGFSSKGRSSNQYALAPIKPFEFDREPAPSVSAKNGNHSGDLAKSGRHRSAKNGSHTPAKSGRGVKSSSYLESTDESLSPSVPTQRAVSSDGANERETSSSIDNPTTTTPPAATPTDTPVDRIIAAYTTVLGRPVLTRTRTALHQQATEALDAGYPEEWLTGRARELAAHGWSDLAKHIEKSVVPLPGAEPPAASRAGLPDWCGECGVDYNGAARVNPRFRRHADGNLCHCHPDAADRKPLPGTDTTVSGWLALAGQLREEGSPAFKPSVTDQRVQQALDVGRQMQAEADARRGGYQSYRQPTPEDRAADLGHF